MRRHWLLAAVIFFLAGLVAAHMAQAKDPAAAFRKQYSLVPYTPPAWFLAGLFMARERRPSFLFGPVSSFIRALGGKTAWLIEDRELKRKDKPNQSGQKPEYTIYLEAAYPGGVEYWVFVVLPYRSAQDWYQARYNFHRSKAEAYYGQTRDELARALGRGGKIGGELRFCLKNGETVLATPADIITRRFGIKPVYDLKAGRGLKAGK